MKIVSMSIVAGCLILAVILLHPMLRRYAPKWVIPILWVLVGVRLVLPVSIESPFSLIPETNVVQQESTDNDTSSVDAFVDGISDGISDDISGEEISMNAAVDGTFESSSLVDDSSAEGGVR